VGRPRSSPRRAKSEPAPATRLAGTGKQIRRTIGTVDTHSLAEAREAARAVIRDAGQGIDSASRQALKEAARQAQREAERATAGSVRATVDAYLADRGKGGAPL
jgi:vacuolar-type H+-ATPase subunit H